MTAPTVLFVCVHNAGRSQMAAGYMRALSEGAVEVLSGGSEPGDQINPVAVDAMAEEGIDISQAVPHADDDRAGARIGCRHHDGLRRRLPDLPRQALRGLGARRPRGQGLDEVRPIRDDIRLVSSRCWPSCCRAVR